MKSFIGWIMLQRGKTVERTIEAVPYTPIFKTKEDAMDTDWCHGRSAVKVRVTIIEQP